MVSLKLFNSELGRSKYCSLFRENNSTVRNTVATCEPRSNESWCVTHGPRGILTALST
jgi:hypothetical protein